MLENLMRPLAFLSVIEPLYGLAQTFYPQLNLYLQRDVKPLHLPPLDQERFNQIKESIGVQGEIALYQGDEGCMPANKWTNATPVLITSHFDMPDWEEDYPPFFLLENLVSIKHRYGFLPFLVWSVCLVVGAYFTFQKKTSSFLVLAYFIGKYLCRKFILMERKQSETKAIALCNARQLEEALRYYQVELFSFQAWRKASSWRRLAYWPDGSPRSGGILWEEFTMPVKPRLDRIQNAYFEKVAEEAGSLINTHGAPPLGFSIG